MMSSIDAPNVVVYEVVDRPLAPVIWLDTHAVSQLAAAMESESDSPIVAAARRIYERVVTRRREGAIFSFESDQLTEIEARPEMVRRCSDVLTYVSQGIRTSYLSVRDRHLHVAMKASLANVARVELPWVGAFDDDPFEDQSTKSFFFRVHFKPSADELERRKISNARIAAEWEELRLLRLSEGFPEDERWKRQVELERLGVRDGMLSVVRCAIERRRKGRQPTTSELLNESAILGFPLAAWQRFGGEGLDDLISFYGSAHFLALPDVDIASRLTAWRVIGGEPIKPSDVMDVHNISTFLPYCTHMVLDRAMINAVTRLGINSQYGTQLLRMSELDGVFDQLGIAPL